MREVQTTSFARSAAKSALTEKQRQLITSISRDPLKTYRKTEEALIKWRRKKQELEQHNVGFRPRLDAEQKGTVGRLDPFIMLEMLSEADFVDKKYVEDIFDQRLPRDRDCSM